MDGWNEARDNIAEERHDIRTLRRGGSWWRKELSDGTEDYRGQLFDWIQTLTLGPLFWSTPQFFQIVHSSFRGSLRRTRLASCPGSKIEVLVPTAGARLHLCRLCSQKELVLQHREKGMSRDVGDGWLVTWRAA